MKLVHETRPGLSNGRSWGSYDAEEDLREWTMDPDGGMVQGPLDLAFLRGRKLFLVLEPGQVALLVRDNRLQAVYLEGGHVLEIGTAQRQVPSDSCLVFLAAGQDVRLRWNKLNPVTGACLPRAGAIGHCSLCVDGPSRFYRHFLAGNTAWDEQSLLGAIDQAARKALAGVLEPCAGAGEAAVQTRLTGLAPEELSEVLEEIGLSCRQIAVYTADPPSEMDGIDRTGQTRPLSHNN